MATILEYTMKADRALADGTWDELARATAARVLALIEEGAGADAVASAIVDAMLVRVSKGLLDRGIPQACARSLMGDVEALAGLGSEDEEQ